MFDVKSLLPTRHFLSTKQNYETFFHCAVLPYLSCHHLTTGPAPAPTEDPTVSKVHPRRLKGSLVTSATWLAPPASARAFSLLVVTDAGDLVARMAQDRAEPQN